MSALNKKARRSAGEMTESAIKDKDRRILFYALLFIAFVVVLLFNVLTPKMTDDYSYAAEVRQAHGFLDLLRQEVYHYQTHTGRSVAHMILRIFLTLPTAVFKLANSLMFMVLSLLIYRNIEGRRRYDCLLFIFVQAGMWFFTVSPSQTWLWQDGSCNYLWTTTIVLLFMTICREKIKTEGIQKQNTALSIVEIVILVILGIMAGWCNENTSGGCVLFMLFLLVRQKVRKKKIPVWLWIASAANAFGLFMMIKAPGNWIREGFDEENYAGLLKYAARFQKATLDMRDNFLPLFLIFIAACVITILQERPVDFKAIFKALEKRIWYAVLFLACSYALVMTAQPVARAYFGAGIFLMIACLQGIIDCVRKEELIAQFSETQRSGTQPYLVRAVVYTAACASCLMLFFTWAEQSVNLERIFRDSRARIREIEAQIESGNSEKIIVSQLHPGFDNRYTVAYESDLNEDPGYWTNVSYETYYDVPTIIALPYEDTEEAESEE